MNDPLVGFDWQSLYARYDAACHRFDSHSQHLAFFKSSPPSSDRDLYYVLVKNFSLESLQKQQNLIGLYQAMIYWKLYSQQTQKEKWFTEDAKQSMGEKLGEMVRNLPKLERNANQILAAIEYLGHFQLTGMKTHPSLPVRTTFLHFIYPDVVPIFDKMVLRAIGITQDGANQNLDILRDYLPFAWSLAERYQHHFAQFKETSIRLIDMALWVTRDKK